MSKWIEFDFSHNDKGQVAVEIKRRNRVSEIKDQCHEARERIAGEIEYRTHLAMPNVIRHDDGVLEIQEQK